MTEIHHSRESNEKIVVKYSCPEHPSRQVIKKNPPPGLEIICGVTVKTWKQCDRCHIVAPPGHELPITGFIIRTHKHCGGKIKTHENTCPNKLVAKRIR